MEGCLNVSNKEGVLVGRGISAVHHGEVLGLSIVILSEDSVLVLPGLIVGELGELPPVLEASSLLSGHFNLIHDHVFEHGELISREVLVEGNVSGLLNPIEAEFSNGADDLSFRGAGEESKEHVEGSAHDTKKSQKGKELHSWVILLLNSVLLQFSVNIIRNVISILSEGGGGEH